MSKERMQQISAKMNIPTDKPNMNGRIYTEEAVQNMVKKMRKLNEEFEGDEHKNLQTPDDQPREEEAFGQELDPYKVMIEFRPLEVYDDYVKWGGVIDDGIKFKYRVPALPGEEGVKFAYEKDEFNVDNPDNKEITDAIENYYQKFYTYWRDNNAWREGIFSNAEGDTD